MKRIDLRIYVDDEIVPVGKADIEAAAQNMSQLVKDGMDKTCLQCVPEGFITVMYSIDENADYPNDMYM